MNSPTIPMATPPTMNSMLTNQDLYRIWDGLYLGDYTEREVVDRLDTFCVESHYTYELPEGVLHINAQDVIPHNYFEDIMYAELEGRDGKVYDMSRIVAAADTALILKRMGWKETRNTAGDVTLVRMGKPRVGYKPADGTLIIGYHEHPQKVYTYTDIKKIIDK